MSHSGAEECAQGCVDVAAGADQLIIDLSAGTCSSDTVEEPLQRFEVSFAEGSRVAGQVIDRFHSFKSGGIVEGEIEFIIIHDMEYQDVMPRLSQRGQSLERLLFTAEEIRGQNHEAPFGVRVVDLAEYLGQIGFVGRLGLLQRAVDGLQMVPTRSPRKFRADLLIEQGESHGVLLSKG